MNFTDQVFVRLADPTTRASVFDQVALEQLAASAYDVSTIGLEGPYGAVFEDLQMGLFTPSLGVVDGAWGCVGSPDRIEAAFRVAGVTPNANDVRVDAFWRGAIVGRITPANSRIERVEIDWPTAAEGGSESHVANVEVQFSGPVPAVAAPRSLPVAIALLIREPGFSVAALVAESKVARDRLASLGLERGTDPTLHARMAVVVAWIVPETVFDDADWGGASGGTDAERRAQRRAYTGQWLAREGIGLITTT